MRTLVLVRHGETVGKSSVRYYGRTDVELSELGRAQMRSAGRWLERRFGSAGFAPVISSPLRRATEGASIVAGIENSIVKIKEFVEVDFGRFEGLTAEEIHARYPEDFERWNSHPLDPGFTYPGGESRAEFADRVGRGINQLLEVVGSVPPVAGGAALVVAHRGVLRIIANRLTGAEPIIELGSIQILRRDTSAGEWRAEMIDVVEHLAEVK
jgi:broad specificity phosphatase PhoE